MPSTTRAAIFNHEMKHRTYAVCVRNEGHEAALELRKICEIVRSEPKDPRGWLRVIDESGEDYLFPATLFLPIELSAAVEHAFASEVAEP